MTLGSSNTYVGWSQIVQGDFGGVYSVVPVATILGGGLPNTLGGYILSSCCYGGLVTIPLVIVSAKYQDSWINPWYTSGQRLGLSYSWVLGRFIITVLVRC